MTEVTLSNYQVIDKDLRSTSIVNRVVRALGYTPDDEQGQNEALRYISNVLVEIQKTVGDEKKDLTQCTTESIIQSMIDAASFKLPIDGRKLAYLIRYKDTASFQPGFGGFLYKIGEYYKGVSFSAEPVFKGDELTVTDDSGLQGYNLTPINPFNDNVSEMIGMVACLQWRDEFGEKHQKVARVPRSEIDKMRKAAKQDFIWAAWFVEKAKAACLKRVCKIQFKTLLAVQELIEYDNTKHFDLSKVEAGADITPANPVAELRQTIAEREAKPAIEHKPEPTVNTMDAIKGARKAPQPGELSYVITDQQDVEEEEIPFHSQQELLQPEPTPKPVKHALTEEQREKLLDFSLRHYDLKKVDNCNKAATAFLSVLKDTPEGDRQLVFAEHEGGAFMKTLGNKGLGMKVQRFRDLGIKIG